MSTFRGRDEDDRAYHGQRIFVWQLVAVWDAGAAGGVDCLPNGGKGAAENQGVGLAVTREK